MTYMHPYYSISVGILKQIMNKSNDIELIAAFMKYNISDCFIKVLEMETINTKKPKLIDQPRWAMRMKHYLARTEKSYVP